MKLKNKQFWVYIGIIVLMPIMMSVFTGLVLMYGAQNEALLDEVSAF